MIMYLSIMTKRRRVPVYRETRFRLPSGPEQAMGLWVDRIGAGTSRSDPTVAQRLRVVGQYAAVAVEAGQGEFESPASGRLTVKTGDVLLLFPEEPNRYQGTPEWTTRWIVWNGPEAALIARLSGLTPAQPLVRHAAVAVTRTFVALRTLMQEESLPAVLERKRLLLGLLAAVLRHTAPTGDAQRDAMAALIRRLGERDAPQMTIPAMAAECHLSVAQFRRRFRAETGRSPLAFLTALRMADAKALLAQGTLMKDVAEQTGYRDVFHFMRVFRKTTGQTAGQFAAVNGGAVMRRHP